MKTSTAVLSAIIVLLVVIIILLVIRPNHANAPDVMVTTFEECVEVTGIVMESSPRQCRYGEATFVENIGNANEKGDLIRLAQPTANGTVESPLTIQGEARGYWFFEATFPIVLTDLDGLIIAEGYAQAQGDWMTESFVPFAAVIDFETPAYGERGSLILHKANASGLPEHDDALEIPIRFHP